MSIIFIKLIFAFIFIIPLYFDISRLSPTLTLLLFLAACGSAPEIEKTNQTSVAPQKLMVIDESNYVKLSQYYFIRQSRFVQTKKNRGSNLHPTHPGANRVGKDAISVSMITPFDKYIQKMTLTQNGVQVVVTIDNETNRVTISYDGDEVQGSPFTSREEIQPFTIL